MINWRRSERRPDRRKLVIVVSMVLSAKLRHISIPAEGVNISKDGICVETKGLLEPGFVRFLGGVGHEAGMVMWSRKTEQGTYRSGIEFLHHYLGSQRAAFERKLPRYQKDNEGMKAEGINRTTGATDQERSSVSAAAPVPLDAHRLVAV